PTSLNLFVLLPSRPPSPTLLPYTTLFRSCRCPPRELHVAWLLKMPTAATAVLARGNPPAPTPLHRAVLHAAPPKQNFQCTLKRSDRKSTRLNSSHEWISYAVFCLKKKKTY